MRKDKTMRNLIKTSAIALTGVVLAAGAAVAGEQSVYNKYTTTHEYNGHTESTIHVDIENTIERVTEAASIKVETYGGTSNTSIATYKDGELSGRAVSTNEVVVDPTAIITTSSTTETFTGSETISVDTISSNDFRSTTYEHEAGTRF